MHITTTNLTKVYNDGVRVLGGVDVNLGAGMTGLLGANGAGKTTLMPIGERDTDELAGSRWMGLRCSTRCGRRRRRRGVGGRPQR